MCGGAARDGDIPGMWIYQRGGYTRKVVILEGELDIECVKHIIGAFCGRGGRDLAGFMAMECV